MALRLENKNALITGGASGIGRATAIRFAEEGANVFVADRHLAAAEETAASVKKLGRKAVAYQVDTSDEAQVNAMVAQMVKELGSVNIVVAAAGMFRTDDSRTIGSAAPRYCVISRPSRLRIAA